MDLVQLRAFLAGDAAESRRGARPRPGRPDAAQVPRPLPGRDHQARHDRRAAPRASSTGRITSTCSTARRRRATPRPPSCYAANRFSVTRQLALQPRRDAARARPVPVHQRPAHRHLRAEEQPDQADGRGRRRSSTSATATRARSCSSSAAASCTSRWTTTRCASARTCTGKGSWFLPFNQGWNDGAGNPPNPDGLKTDYLWKRILTPRGPDRHPRELRADRRGRRTRRPARRSAVQIWPRYHQLDVVRQAPGRRARSTARAGAT